MQYLVISVDIGSTGIKEEFGRDLTLEDLKVSESLWNELSNWVKEYSKIIPLSMNERKKNMSLIEDLDKKGLELTKKFLDELKDVKIKYYSEGLLKYLI